MRKLSSSNTTNEKQLSEVCPMHTAMQLLSGRWKIALIWYIHTGLNRFGLLQRKLPAITNKMLSQQLRELEHDGLLNRHIYAEMPPRVEYSLTETGQTLVPIFKQLYEWGEGRKAAMNELSDSQQK